MGNMKMVGCIGMKGIVSVDMECPTCGDDISFSAGEFFEKFGNPNRGEHKGKVVKCPSCKEYFRLGQFEIL